MGARYGWHILAVLVIVLLLFGAPKLPELARSIGKSARILKEETKALTAEEDSAKPAATDEAKDK